MHPASAAARAVTGEGPATPALSSVRDGGAATTAGPEAPGPRPNRMSPSHVRSTPRFDEEATSESYRIGSRAQGTVPRHPGAGPHQAVGTLVAEAGAFSTRRAGMIELIPSQPAGNMTSRYVRYCP